MRWLSLVVALAAVASAVGGASASPDPMPPEGPTAKAPSGDGDLAGMTDDPIVGHAARVNGDETSGVVAFTFDDGPNPETTPAVIDALEQYDIPATFFIVTQRLLGKHGEKGREILQRELAGGFMVGSHSVTHPNLKHAAGAQITKEIDNSFRTLSKETGHSIGLFRPPYGALSGAGRVRLKKLGVTEVIWSVDTLDWKAKNADRLRKKVISMIVKQNGGIVLMHDVKPITAKIVGEVLDDLEAENCKRLGERKDPIIPVSLHYFLRDGKTPRPVPAEVQKRTDAYRLALPVRCANRLAHAPEGPKSAAAEDSRPASTSIGDFGRPDEKPRTPIRHRQPECLNNPLARGCS